MIINMLKNNPIIRHGRLMLDRGSDKIRNAPSPAIAFP